jgi:hypothetical protein
LAVPKDQLLSGTTCADPARSDSDTPEQHDPARFSAADRLWAAAWSAAADDGGWMVDDMRPGEPSGTDEPDRLFVYPPASASRDAAWRRANQLPCLVTAIAAGVSLHDPAYMGLPQHTLTFSDLRAALLSLAALSPSLLSLVDALAEARADFAQGAKVSAVPAFGRPRRSS